jgi:hypothetical protein
VFIVALRLFRQVLLSVLPDTLLAKIEDSQSIDDDSTVLRLTNSSRDVKSKKGVTFGEAHASLASMFARHRQNRRQKQDTKAQKDDKDNSTATSAKTTKSANPPQHRSESSLSVKRDATWTSEALPRVRVLLGKVFRRLS